MNFENFDRNFKLGWRFMLAFYAAVVISILVAASAWAFFDQPFLRVFAGASVVLAVILVLWAAWVYYRGGFNRLKPSHAPRRPPLRNSDD